MRSLYFLTVLNEDLMIPTNRLVYWVSEVCLRLWSRNKFDSFHNYAHCIDILDLANFRKFSPNFTNYTQGNKVLKNYLNCVDLPPIELYCRV